MEKYFEKNKDIQLIHFTNSLENIISILNECSLRLKYCREEFCIPDKTISQRVHPMVCFSEQKTNQLSNKVITYGKYGIAFSPQWVIKRNIQPVMYIEKNSAVASSLATLLIHRRNLPKGHELRLPIMTITCFVKNTIGYNSYFDQDNFLFKDENEWRYVPTKKQIDGGYISESRSVFNKNPEHYNKQLLSYPLKFNIDKDIICVYCSVDQEHTNLVTRFPLLKNRLKTAMWH
jgi:hypothetical protein